MVEGKSGSVALLAASVADGAPVDWSRAEADLPERERRLLRHLRLVENIATLHRTLPDDAAEDVPVLQEPSGPRWGPLVLLDRIGEGASSEVYRAWDPQLHRHVALKLVRTAGFESSDADLRVLGEARRLARIRHEHVVHVYGAERHDGRVGLWMELVSGESLEHIVSTRGPLGARESAGIGQDLCAALAAVHGAGLLHRDVKAQNVIREHGGRIVLMDFGTGEALRHNLGTTRLMGTPLYLAPEVFAGKAATVQSDIYSLGVLLFYLVTGEFPVVAASVPQLVQVHADGRRRRLRDARADVPESFVHAVERALNPDPTARYESAGEMESALRDSLAPRAALPAPVRPAAARYTAFAAIAAAMILLVTALAFWSRGVQRSTPPGAEARRVAVLPLVDSTGTPQSAAITEALTGELISTLGQIRSLQVAPLSSALRYKGSTTPDVDAIVEGSVDVDDGVTDEGDKVRANIRVMAAGRTTPLWQGSFSRLRGQMEMLQADIAHAVATAIGASITAEEANRFRRARQTSPAAEEAYIQGRIHLTHYGPEPARSAVAAFQRAIGLDDRHAAAHAGLGRAYITLAAHGGMSHPDARASALEAGRKALALNDSLPDAHAVLAEIYFRYDWDWHAAEREYLRGLELNPSYTYARGYYAQFLAALKRFDEAYSEAIATRAQDPDSSEARVLPAMVQYYRGDFDAAERDVQSDSLVLARIREAQGRLDEALSISQRAADASSPVGVPLRVSLIRRKALAGQREAAAADLRALEQDAANRVVRITSRDRGYVQLAVGNVDAALAAFEDALDDRDPSLVWLGVDPRLDPLRAHPRFQAMLRRMKLP